MATTALIFFGFLSLIISSISFPSHHSSFGHKIMASTSYSNTSDDDIFKFFPDCKNDGLNLRWAHAVNSWPYLNETLSNETIHRVHMIEGDVIIRQQSHECPDDVPIPVMAHPPATDSNLTFQDWLTTINQFPISGLKNDQSQDADPQNDQIRAGAKADFKSLDAAVAALKIVQGYNQSLTIPLWLNADIVHGPGGGGSAIPVDPQQFLRACTDYAPGLTLSLGWTTPQKIDLYRCRRGYAWHEMLNIFHQIRPFINETAASGNLPRITFAVRAALVKATYFRLMYLLDSCANAAGGDQFADRFSITLWTSAGVDQLTIDDYVIITRLRLTLGRNRVFVDLPDPDVGCLRELDPFGTTDVSTSSIAFDRSKWELINKDDAVMTGERVGVAFFGSTTTEIKSVTQYSGSVLNFRLIFIAEQQPSSESAISDHPNRQSILVTLADNRDQSAWIFEISNTKCNPDHATRRSNRDCIQIQSDQTYSISISVDGRQIKVNWKTEDEEPSVEIPSTLSTGCDLQLNCTRRSSSSQGSKERNLDHEVGNFSYVIQKMGTGDTVMQKVIIEKH